ncbi:MAG: Rpn family recombination-promoting nuclease/putative transposase [Planctomycetaceae bacterium]
MPDLPNVTLEFPRDFADVICREALKQTANLRDFVSDALPEIAARLDFDRAKLLDPEFRLNDWQRRESDLLFLIPARDGDTESETLICILIEHQSQPDSRMPLRVLLYAVLYWEREWKTWESLPVPRPDFKLTPIVPLVFHTSNRPWTTSRQLRDLFAGPDAFKAFAPQWPICFWDLAAKTPRELLDSTHTWLKALAVPRAGAEDSTHFAAVLAEAFEQLSALRDQDQIRWYDLRHFMLSWSLRLRPKEERDQIVGSVNKGKHSERETRENRIMAQSIAATIFDEGLEQGLEKGLEQGLEQGRDEGREEGVVIGHIQDLESLLSLATTPVRQFRNRRLNELLEIEANLKAKLANRSSGPDAADHSQSH